MIYGPFSCGYLISGQAPLYHLHPRETLLQMPYGMLERYIMFYVAAVTIKNQSLYHTKQIGLAYARPPSSNPAPKLVLIAIFNVVSSDSSSHRQPEIQRWEIETECQGLQLPSWLCDGCRKSFLCCANWVICKREATVKEDDQLMNDKEDGMKVLYIVLTIQLLDICFSCGPPPAVCCTT